MWSNRQKMHDADAERNRQNLPEPTASGLWRVPGAHVAAMGASFGDRVGGAVSLHSLRATRVLPVFANEQAIKGKKRVTPPLAL